MDDNLGNIKLLVAGEQGMVVDFGSEVSVEINTRVQQLVRSLTTHKIDGVTEVVPTYRSVMVYFDPVLITRSELAATIKRCLDQNRTNSKEQNTRKIIHIPVCYGGVFGPDIDFVVRRTGLLEEEVIKIHTSKPFLVYMLGFTPGFPYLGGLPEKLIVQRLEKSRVKIPEGSVGIAGKQTGFYTVQSTGGWRLIGRTPIKAFNPDNPNPFLFVAGDYIQFKPITVDEFFAIRRELDAGTYLSEVSYERAGELT